MLKKFFEEQSAAQSGDIESDRQGFSSVAGCPVGRQSTPKQSFVNIMERCPDQPDQSVLKESRTCLDTLEYIGKLHSQ